MTGVSRSDGFQNAAEVELRPRRVGAFKFLDLAGFPALALLSELESIWIYLSFILPLRLSKEALWSFLRLLPMQCRLECVLRLCHKSTAPSNQPWLT